jgi:cell division protein FtsI (penicillin-binding protein 3)/stage V sporulation protein D (sporulation-specific penicillin-binding protein)
MAAALEEHAVTRETPCDSTCDGPVTIGNFTIRTWDNQYHPGQTMQQVLERSDNTGMIFVAFQLGKEKFVDYINKFGFGHTTGIDLQEETVPALREKWGDIDLATASFGQGIAVTGIQMVRAVAAIANGGYLIEPKVVSEVIADTPIPVNSATKERIITEDTARILTQMMVDATHKGEARWAVLRDYQIAGKTGTAQIPISGHYDQEKTIASFIGFAPAQDPKFVMLVKLREPSSSPWAAETAAPLWHQLASDVLFHLNIPPDKQSL